MSRWREMLMDYGQAFTNGSKTYQTSQSRSRTDDSSSSEIYSVDGDMVDFSRGPMDLRKSLELYFRPLFQRYVYGGEKVACHDMRRILRDPEYRDKLPPDKVAELADITDFNKGRAITYTEFVRIVMGRGLREDDTISFDSDFSDPKLGKPSMYAATGILPVVCRNTVQQEVVEDHVKDYKCLPPAIFMILITIAQIVVYAYYCSKDVSNRLLPLEGVPPTNDIWYTPSRRREAWRFVTYCFLHDGYVDLIFNVIFQLALGIPLEIMFTWRAIVVYILGVIAGSLGQSVCDHYVGLVGAAGGALALTAAHAYALVDNWSTLNNNEKEDGRKRMICSVTLRLCIMVILAAAQIALAVWRRFGADNVPLIGIAGHVGGVLTGLFLGNAFLKDVKRYPWQAGAGYLNLFLFMIFIGFAIVFNIMWAGYPVEEYP